MAGKGKRYLWTILPSSLIDIGDDFSDSSSPIAEACRMAFSDRTWCFSFEPCLRLFVSFQTLLFDLSVRLSVRHVPLAAFFPESFCPCQSAGTTPSEASDEVLIAVKSTLD